MATPCANPETTSSWDDLPSNLLYSIYQLCRAADVARCNAVSRKWGSTAFCDHTWAAACTGRLRLAPGSARSHARDLLQTTTWVWGCYGGAGLQGAEARATAPQSLSTRLQKQGLLGSQQAPTSSNTGPGLLAAHAADSHLLLHRVDGCVLDTRWAHQLPPAPIPHPTGSWWAPPNTQVVSIALSGHSRTPPFPRSPQCTAWRK
jgi:hypothetical protein